MAKGASGRSSARRPCPQGLQGHPRVAKSHLTKDKPVSARCKDRLSYRLAYRQTCRMVSYACLTDRQTGLPYRQPYLKLSPAGSHGSSIPPTLLTGFVSQTFRPPDRQTYRQVSSARLSDRQTERQLDLQTGLPYRQPDRQPHRPATPASHTSQPNQPARPTSPTGQPDRPAQPTSTTSQPNRPARPASPTNQTGHPRPAIHPGKGPAGLSYR